MTDKDGKIQQSKPYNLRKKPAVVLCEKVLKNITDKALQKTSSDSSDDETEQTVIENTLVESDTETQSSVNFSSPLLASTPNPPTGSQQDLRELERDNSVTPARNNDLDPAVATFFNNVLTGPRAIRNRQGMAATTITDAFATLQTDARTPKFIAPTIFDPTSGNFESFIETFNRCAEINGWNEKHKIVFLESYLSGVAVSWYRDFKADHPLSNWNDIKTALEKEYGNPNYSREIRFQLLNKKQGAEEDIKVYFYGILELCKKLTPPPSDEVLLDYFERGLHPSYITQFNLLASSTMTQEKLKEVVNKLSNIRKRAVEAHMSDPLVTPPINRRDEGCATLNRTFVNKNRTKFNSERSARGQPKCYFCNKVGHLSYVCFNNPNNNASYDRANISNRSNFHNNEPHKQGGWHNSNARKNFNSQNSRQQTNYNSQNNKGRNRNDNYERNTPRNTYWDRASTGNNNAGRDNNTRQ